MEVFKDIEGYEKMYQISNLGNVKSLRRLSHIGHLVKEKILKQGLTSRGYYSVTLNKGGKQKTFITHQLVAFYFLNHKIKSHNIVVNHIDLNKQNNHVDNLEIVTARENSNMKHIPSSSKFVGVSWDKNSNKWKAYISIKKKLKHLGLFTDEHEAHLAYEKKLKEITTN